MASAVRSVGNGAEDGVRARRQSGQSGKEAKVGDGIGCIGFAVAVGVPV
ncbi:MAG: hypothetical protein ACHQ50_16620 [Fimbriimonadales bacterium]